MDSRLSRICDGIIEAGWLAAIVATPLFFNIHSARVFEPDKLTLLRSIAFVMLVAWLIKFADERGWQSLAWLNPRDSDTVWAMPFALPVLLIALVYALSTLFSVVPVVSWAGSYQRLQGTYTTLSYLVVFALTAATMRRREQASRLVTTAIIVSIPVSLYAMLQHFGLDPLPWGGDVQTRVAGHMGNSIFIGAYIIMVTPLTLSRIVDAFTNILGDEELSLADVVRSSIYIFAIAIQLLAIFWSQSRGPLLGLAVGLYAFVLIMLVTLRNAEAPDQSSGAGSILALTRADAGKAIGLVALGTILPLVAATTLLPDSVPALTSFGIFFGAVGFQIVVILVLALARRAWRWLWLSWIMVAVLMAGFLGLFNFSNNLQASFNNAPVVGESLETMVSWRQLPQIGRFGRLLESERGSGRVRVLIWEGVLDLIAPHEPLATPDGDEDTFNFLRQVLGYGPESMYVAYNRFYQPELATIEARNASPDRSHNETFDALVITGWAGLLAWQFLYLSVFYYAFRWLGVVRSTRDRNVLVGLWIGGGVVGGGVIVALLGMPFLGVALPFGAIAGLVIYLIYYAVVAGNEGGGGDDADPFGLDRLLLIGLVAAVLAHYVEIHFGIAIAATRTHFFVYLALLFIVGFYLEYRQSEPELKRRRGRGRRRRSTPQPPEGWQEPVLLYGLVLALIMGVLAYNFTTFSLPPGQTLESVADVPGAGEIFRQSMFVNPNNGFAESPFVYLLLMLTWILGSALAVSELSKAGKLSLSNISRSLAAGRERVAAGILLGQVILLAGARLISGAEVGGNVNNLLGGLLVAVWVLTLVWAAVLLLLARPSARLLAGSLSLAGLVMGIPILAAGSPLTALVVGGGGAIAAYLLWDRAWNDLLVPAALIAGIAIVIGLAYAYLHAAQIRAGILPPPGVTESTDPLTRRILEADQAAQVLAVFYWFFFALLLVLGVGLGASSGGRARQWATSLGYAATALALPLVVFVITTSNLRVVQADIIYKRADPWDQQASRSNNPELWDNAIAVYEHAIDYAPAEDFYYLWLGRAYLERSSVTEQDAEQDTLLRTAETRLEQAQELNPLNTDHTANLARLHTRWAEQAEGEARQQLVNQAVDYYQSAISLSPQNAVIMNEYARLAFLLQDNCERALNLYQESLERDSFYDRTYFEISEVYQACAEDLAGQERQAYLESAAENLREGLDRQPGQARQWLRLAEISARLGDAAGATEAAQEAIGRGGEEFSPWRVNFTVAQWFVEEQATETALDFAEAALASAPDDARPQIEQLVNQLRQQMEDGG